MLEKIGLTFPTILNCPGPTYLALWIPCSFPEARHYGGVTMICWRILASPKQPFRCICICLSIKSVTIQFRPRLPSSAMVARVLRTGAEMAFTPVHRDVYFDCWTLAARSSGSFPEGPDHARPTFGTTPQTGRPTGFSTFRYIIPDATASTSFVYHPLH